MGTKDKTLTFSSALFGKTRLAILVLLYGHIDESFYLREIVRTVGVGQGAVQRELKRLSEAGIIESFKRGKQVYYKANRQCPIFPDIQGLILKTAGLADIVRRALLPLKKNIENAFIYGSQANGSATAKSDVDLLIIGDIDEMLLHRAIGKAEKELRRSINYTLLNKREFEQRHGEKDGFINRVLAEKKIPLIG